MPEYKITIRSEADLRAAKELESTLKKAGEAARKAGGDTRSYEQELNRVRAAITSESAAHATRAAQLEKSIKLTKQLGGDTRALQSQLREANAALGRNPTFMNRMGERFQDMRDAYGEGHSRGGFVGGALAVAGRMNPAVAAGLVVGGTAVKAAATGLKEYAAAEKEIFQMNGALALRGQLTEEYSAKLQSLAGELQNATGIQDDDWTRVFTTLTKNGGAPETIDKLVKGVEDLAGVMGGDVNAAALMLSKAMQGNFTMLSRWGIEVDKNATQAEKLDSVLQQVAARGAGQLRAAASGLDGAFARLKNSTGDLWENFGNGINRLFGVEIVVNGVANAMGWLAEKTFLAIEPAKGLRNSIDGLPETLEDTGGAAKNAADNFKQLGEDLDRVKQKADLAKAAIDRTKGIEDEEANAAKRLELAQVDDDVARGRLTETQAGVRKAAIEQRYAGQAMRRQEQADAEREKINQDVREAIVAKEMVAKVRAEDIAKQITPQDQIDAARARHGELSTEAADIRRQLDAVGLRNALNFAAGPTGMGQPVNIDTAALTRRLEELEVAIGKEGRFVSTREARNRRARADLDAFEETRIAESHLSAQQLALVDAEQEGLRANRNSRRRVFAMDTRTRATVLGTDLVQAQEDPQAIEEVKQSVLEIRKLNAEVAQLQRDFTTEMLALGFKNQEDLKRALEGLRELRSIQEKTNRGN